MTAAVSGNGFDPKLVKQFVGDAERLETEMESKKGEYLRWCKSQRELINGILDRAKDAGIPKGELKTVLKIRRLERKAKAARDDLEPDAQDTVDMIRHALGDDFSQTDLGAAALQRASGASVNGAALDDLVDDDDDASEIEDDGPDDADEDAGDEDGEDLRPRHLKQREADRAAESEDKTKH